jgi:hypothetical protein
LTGTIPESITKLQKLKLINIGRNQLTGPLPSSLEKLASKLEFLSVYFNLGITGKFDDLLCSMKSLNTLYIGLTGMDGEIPLCLTEMTELKKLDIGDTFFEGPLPEKIGDLTKLDELWLNDLRDSATFTGPLPEGFGQLKALKFLYMGVPTLSGPLPEINFQLDTCDLVPAGVRHSFSNTLGR